MSTPLTADQMVAALKKEGVHIVEHSGWRTHNRAGHGAWGPVNGIIIHHTAGADTNPGMNLVFNGRSDLPGPLAHAYLGKNGTVTLTGNGRANHAGLGDGRVLTAVVHEFALPKPVHNDTDGNAHFYGIEIANLGNGKDPYPATQYQAAVKWAAAICRAHGWTEKSVIGHKEWTNQKIDPSFDMAKFRKDVGARLRPVVAPKTPVDTKTQTTTTAIVGGPHQLEISKTSVSTLTPNQWYDISFANEATDEGQIFTAGDYRFGAKGTYSGLVHFQLSNVPAGDEIQVRVVERNSTDVIVKLYPIVEGIGSEGGTYFAVPFNGLLAASKTLSVQIYNATTQDVTLEHVRVLAQWWVRS